MKIIKLENLIYTTIFLLPTYLIRFDFLGLPTNFFEILIGLILVGWIIKNYKNKDAINHVSTIWLKYKKYLWPIILILAGIFISTFKNCAPIYVSTRVSTDVLTPAYMCSTGLGIIKGWFIVPLVFVFLISIVIPKEKIKNVFLAYYISSLGVAIISIFYLLSGRLTFDGRLQGIFNSPNYLAMYLAPAVIIALAQIQNKNNSKSKIVYLFISLSIILFALYKTYSYSAWLAVIISLLIIYLIKRKISFKKIFLAATIIILLIFSQLHNKKLVSALDSRSSLASRAMIWKSAGKILEDKPVFGIGPGNFQNKYLEYQKYFPSYLEWAVSHPHNVFLAFWLSGGLLSLAGFLWLLFLYFKNIFTRLKSAPANILYVSLDIMLYILLHGLVDTTIFKNDLAVVFWLCFIVL